VARLNRPPRLPADASPLLASLLAAMTALDPTQRPAATEVAARLRSLAGRMTGDPDATGRMRLIASVPGARPPAPARLAAAAAAVALVLGTGVALLMDGGAPRSVPAAAADRSPSGVVAPAAKPSPSPTASAARGTATAHTGATVHAVAAMSVAMRTVPPSAAPATPVRHATTSGRPAPAKQAHPVTRPHPATKAKPPKKAEPAKHGGGPGKAPKPAKGKPGKK
jgi:hypothetical protein